jgi:hypothetical protein
VAKHNINKPVIIVKDSVASMVTQEELEAGYEGNMKTRLSLATFMSTALKHGGENQQKQCYPAFAESGAHQSDYHVRRQKDHARRNAIKFIRVSAFNCPKRDRKEATK